MQLIVLVVVVVRVLARLDRDRERDWWLSEAMISVQQLPEMWFSALKYIVNTKSTSYWKADGWRRPTHWNAPNRPTGMHPNDPLECIQTTHWNTPKRRTGIHVTIRLVPGMQSTGYVKQSSESVDCFLDPDDWFYSKPVDWIIRDPSTGLETGPDTLEQTTPDDWNLTSFFPTFKYSNTCTYLEFQL